MLQAKGLLQGNYKEVSTEIKEKMLTAAENLEFEIAAKLRDRLSAVEQLGKKQFLVPYLMSSHPGATLKDAVELAEFIRDEKLHPEQVQDYYPTPGTISTAMYYTELDPYTLKKVYVAKTPHEKALQRALMQYFIPKNYDLVYEALKKSGRNDLIGTSKKCLIKPKQGISNNYKVKENDFKRKKTIQKRKKKS